MKLTYDQAAELLNKAVLEIVPTAREKDFFYFPGGVRGPHIFGFYTGRAYREIRTHFKIPNDKDLFEFLSERYRPT